MYYLVEDQPDFEARQPLAGCPGQHVGNWEHCDDEVIACFEGPLSGPLGTRASGDEVVANVGVRSGSRRLCEALGPQHLDEWEPDWELSLYVNEENFATDRGTCAVWPLVAVDNHTGRLYVRVYRSGHAAEKTYRKELLGRLE